MRPNPVLEKANRIHGAGLTAVRNGQVKPFSFAPDLKQRYNCSMIIGKSATAIRAEAQLLSDIITPIRCKAIPAGVDCLACVVHYPAHSTLCEALTLDGSDAPDSFEIEGFPDLSRTAIPFTELVCDKATTFLAVSEIPEEILEVRAILEKFYADRGLKPLPITDLLHMTVARITSGGPEAIRDYTERLLDLRNHLKENPLRMTFGGFWKGSAARLLKQ